MGTAEDGANKGDNARCECKAGGGGGGCCKRKTRRNLKGCMAMGHTAGLWVFVTVGLECDDDTRLR